VGHEPILPGVVKTICKTIITLPVAMSRNGLGASPYPRFSDSEMTARRRSLADEISKAGVEHVLVYGANRFGSAVQWLCRWPVTREAVVVFTPEERDTLFVQFRNHVRNAERIATEADVRWGGDSTIESVVAELESRGANGVGIGIIGQFPFGYWARLQSLAGDIVDLNAAYTRLRLVKSSEELDWVRTGARLTDLAIASLEEGAGPGMTETQLADLVERAYVAEGGTNHIHYYAATPMDAPRLGVPAQWPSDRRLTTGDALVCEISASFWDYPGQVLRTFTVGEEPNALYRDLHEVAQRTFDAIVSSLRPGVSASELVQALRIIEDAGFSICDDLVHGFVGGYLPPVLHDSSRASDAADFVLQAGMTVVVQPNVITPDGSAGVQTGELLLVTDGGAERLHATEPGMRRIG
jgi:Xaa-Pro dipeptidase